MSELKRHMGLFHLTMYGVGIIIGAGIYVLIGEATSFAGNSVWISFLLGMIAAVFAGYDIVLFGNGKRNKIDIIVIGARGISFAREIFLGSTSHFVLHKSKISVMVVK